MVNLSTKERMLLEDEKFNIKNSEIERIKAGKRDKDLTRFQIEEIERIQFQAASFHTGKRLSKVGRPTKKQRRDIETCKWKI